MYFSTVLVLLLTCKFMQLQPIQPPVEDIIPFGYKYIPGTGEFLKSVMHDFKTFPTEKLKIYMSDFLQRNLYDSNRCKTKKISTFFFLEEDNCTTWCNESNTKYVDFLNNNIGKIKNSLFQDGRTFTLVLNAIDSNSRRCVWNEKENMFHCLCKASYEIMVSKKFYITFIHIIYNILNHDDHTIKRQEFSALAILLKFYPQCAVFYLAYLFYKYDRLSSQCLFTPTLLSPTEFTLRRQVFNGIVIQDTNGMVTDIGKVAENGTEIRIFMKMYELIVNDSCDLRAIGEKYYREITKRPLTLVVLIIAAGLLHLFDNNKKKSSTRN